MKIGGKDIIQLELFPPFYEVFNFGNFEQKHEF